ncbi:MAG: hypothetical protein WCW64_11645 [Phycisphaerae bacterium]|jgi:hypothetical protein
MKKDVLKIALMILLCYGGLVSATPVNSNSVVIDDIEFYVQTDKSGYSLGESVEILFKVTNLGNTDVTIGCSRHGEFNYLVRKNNEDIWALAHWFAWDMPVVSLSAGETITLPSYAWNMKDDAGILILPDAYSVVGLMYNEPWNDASGRVPRPTEVSVPITIIPEPCSMALFVTSLLLCNRFKKK